MVIVAAISLLGSLPYIIDSLKGKTKPNLATWSTWTLINLIVLVAALAASDAVNTAVLGGTYLAGSSTILLIAIFRGTRKYTLFDGICQAIALIGVVLWQLSNNPNVALLCVVLVDVFAVMPTWRHAYHYPHEETWITFAIATIGSFGLLALATSIDFDSIAIPLEATFINASIAALIVHRRRQLKGS